MNEEEGAMLRSTKLIGEGSMVRVGTVHQPMPIAMVRIT